jgi:hypothetical protein
MTLYNKRIFILVFTVVISGKAWAVNNADELSKDWYTVDEISTDTLCKQAQQVLHKVNQEYLLQADKVTQKAWVNCLFAKQRLQEQVNRLEAKREEVYIDLSKTSPTYVSDVTAMILKNFAMLSDFEAKDVYPYLFGKSEKKGYLYSQEEVSEKIRSGLAHPEDENHKKTLRQISYLLRNAVSKEQFDAYLQGPDVLARLQKDESEREPLQEEFDTIVMQKGKIADRASFFNKLYEKSVPRFKEFALSKRVRELVNNRRAMQANARKRLEHATQFHSVFTSIPYKGISTPLSGSAFYPAKEKVSRIRY